MLCHRPAARTLHVTAVFILTLTSLVGSAPVAADFQASLFALPAASHPDAPPAAPLTEPAGQAILEPLAGYQPYFPAQAAGEYPAPAFSAPQRPAATYTGWNMIGLAVTVGHGTHVIATQDFFSEDPSWSDISGDISGSGENWVLRLDPFDPTNKAYVLTDAHLWYTEDLQSDPPTWESVLSLAAVRTQLSDSNAMFEPTMQVSPLEQGYVALLVKEGDNDVLFAYTHDAPGNDINNWTFTDTTANDTWGAGVRSADVYVSPTDLDIVYVAVTGSCCWTYIQLSYSSDGGDSFDLDYADMYSDEGKLTIFVEPGTDDQVIYVGRGGNTTGNQATRLVRTTGGPTGSWTDVTPHSSTEKWWGPGTKTAFLWRDDVLYLGGTNRSLSWEPDRNSATAFLSTDDRGASWTVIDSIAACSSTPECPGYAGDGFNGWLGHPTWMVMGNAGLGKDAIAFSDDIGESWSDKTGDLGDLWVDVFRVQYLAPVVPLEYLSDEMILNLALAKGANPDTRSCSLICWARSVVLAGDPINTRTGGVDYTTVDLSMPTDAGQLVWQRSYSSLTTSARTAPLGYGWTSNQDLTLTLGGGQAVFKDTSGNLLTFYEDEDGTYTPFAGITASLVANGYPNTTSYTLTAADQSAYTFDTNGKITAWADPQGRAWTYTYDGNDRLDYIADGSGDRFLDPAYNGNGQLTSVTGPGGVSVSYTYDGNGDLATYTDPNGKVWTYSYDGTSHRLTQIEDPLDRTLQRYVYDAQGRAYQAYDGLNHKVLEIAFNADGTRTVTDALGNVSTITYNGQGAANVIQNAAGDDTIRTFEPSFRISQVTNANGGVTKMAWSSDGANLTGVTDPLNNITGLVYNSHNHPTSITDPLSHTAVFTYTGILLTQLTDALGNATNYAYTTGADAPQPPNLLKTIADAAEKVTRLTYTAQGDLRTVTLNYVDGAYNSDFPDEDVTTTYTYTVQGRLDSIGDNASHVTQFCYDDAGHLVKTIKNPTSGSPCSSYDTSDLADQDVITQSTYDDSGHILTTTDAGGIVTLYCYDDNARLVKTILNPSEGIQDYCVDYDLGSDQAKNIIHKYTYDLAGNLIAVTDPLGHITRTYYDVLNRPQTIVRNLTGQDIEETTPPTRGSISDQNLRTDYLYDSAGNLIAVTNELGKITRNYYDLANRLTTTVANFESASIMDPPPSWSSQNPDQNIVTRFYYDAAGNLVRRVENNSSQTTVLCYDADNRPIKEIHNSTRTDTGSDTSASCGSYTPSSTVDRDVIFVTTYDAVGNAIARTDPDGFITRTYYDALGRPRYVVGNLYGQAIDNPAVPTYSAPDRNLRLNTIVYGAAGLPVQNIDNADMVTSFTLDAVNRVTATVQNYTGGSPDWQTNLTTTLTYDKLGNVETQIDPASVTTFYEYDEVSRLMAVVENYIDQGAHDEETNVRTEYRYDRNGNRLAIRDARSTLAGGTPYETVFTYDDADRLETETDPLSNTWTYGYNVLGSQTSLLDANGDTTNYVYDDVQRLIAIDYPAGIDPAFAYDAMGNREVMTDTTGTTHWTYNLLNRVTQVSAPVTGAVGYAYDKRGNPTVLTYPDARTANYTYDDLGRLSEVTASGEAWGDGAGTTTYDYNQVSQPITTTLPSGVLILRGFDNAHRLTSLTYQTDTLALAQFTYTLNEAGLRTQAIENLRQPLTQWLPLALHESEGEGLMAGGEEQEESGALVLPTEEALEGGYPGPQQEAGESQTLEITPTLEPSATPTAAPTATAVETPTVSPTPEATLTPTPSETPTPAAFGGGHVLAMPALGLPALPALDLDPEAATVITYTYDSLYRLTAADYSTGQYFHYTYDSAGNRLTEDQSGDTTSYEYDDANRLTTVNSVEHTWDDNGNLLDDGTSTYAYDAANRLISAADGVITTTLAYNGLGDRVSQTVNSVTTNYMLDLNAGLTQVLADGSNTYLYGLGRIGEQQPGGFVYHLSDGLGSVRQLANSGSIVTLARSYEPFGRVLSAVGPANTTYGLAGEQRDDSTGLTFLRARYLSSSTGRFLSKDTWGGDLRLPATQNGWVYVNANPVMYTDPSGHGPMPPGSDYPEWTYPGIPPAASCVPGCQSSESDFLQVFEEALNGPIVRCGVGYSPLGAACVPDIVAELLGSDCDKNPGSTFTLLPQAPQTTVHPTLIRPKGPSDWNYLARKLGLTPGQVHENLEKCKHAAGIPRHGDVVVDDETGDIYYVSGDGTMEWIGNLIEGC